MQSAPRPPASVPLGGSVRASRAAQLACPSGPLAAVDLADGRALLAELRGSVWVVALPADGAAAAPPAPGGVQVAEPAASPVRRRRLGTVVALAAALGAAAVALATGFSGSPPPAVAGPTPPAGTAATPVPVAAILPAPARGGRAGVLAAARTMPPPAPPSPPAPPPPPPRAPPPAPVASLPVVPAPPPLPELPPAPAL